MANVLQQLKINEPIINGVINETELTGKLPEKNDVGPPHITWKNRLAPGVENYLPGFLARARTKGPVHTERVTWRFPPYKK